MSEQHERPDPEAAILRVLSAADLRTPQGRQRAHAEILPHICTLPPSTDRDRIVRLIENKIGRLKV